MAIKIIDTGKYEECLTIIEDIDHQIEKLLGEVDMLREDRKVILAKKEECVVHYLDQPVYSHSMELIDKFINDTQFRGRWDFNKFWDRYAGLNTFGQWSSDVEGQQQQHVYYAEVEMRYKDLKREGKL